LGDSRLVFENLTGLERLPQRFELRAYPLALGGDGAPVRAVGVTDGLTDR
jgi:kynurenine formamidase